ncbi:hypothetical protein VB735_16885 [Halotia wernerae UHCC 0503]|nr:hypothetical protein [Halotia wernerae UHCC 0503]
MLLESIKSCKSPQAGSPYIARLVLNSRSEILQWSDVVNLHEKAKSLCPQKFAWWASLPPELWITSLIFSLEQSPTPKTLPEISAMRIDLLPDRQFSGDLYVLLTAPQLVTLRKISYRVRSDFHDYSLSGQQYRGMNLNLSVD